MDKIRKYFWKISERYILHAITLIKSGSKTEFERFLLISKNFPMKKFRKRSYILNGDIILGVLYSLKTKLLAFKLWDII